MSAAQLIGWGFAFLVVALLLAMYFRYGSAARPLLVGLAGVAVWPLS